MTKLKTFLSVLIIFFSLTGLQAQFSRDDAIHLVLDQILINDIGNINVYASWEAATDDQPLLLPNHDQLQYPYLNNWIFFVNDNPYGLWIHPCRYIFVDEATGQYSVIDEVVYPIGLTDKFEIISQIPQIQPKPSTSQPRILPTVIPNSHLYAVLIIGGSDTCFWNDLSAMYSTLIQKYGYKKENIFVLYFTGIQSGSSNPLNDLDGDHIYNDIDYPAYIDSVHNIFHYLAGLATDPSHKVPELKADDQLFIYTGDHGSYYFTPNFHSSICLPQPVPNEYQWDYLTDLDFTSSIQHIKCGQMIIVMGQCFSGGFVAPVMDYTTYPPACKNRTIHTSCGSNSIQVGGLEHYITNNSFSEFMFYWTAAVRGYFPRIENAGSQNPIIMPWKNGDAVFPFPTTWLSCFPTQGLSHPVCDDHSLPQYIPDPDLNHDGIITMDEAFSYADNMDSYTGYQINNNYYCPPTQCSAPPKSTNTVSGNSRQYEEYLFS